MVFYVKTAKLQLIIFFAQHGQHKNRCPHSHRTQHCFEQTLIKSLITYTYTHKNTWNIDGGKGCPRKYFFLMQSGVRLARALLSDKTRRKKSWMKLPLLCIISSVSFSPLSLCGISWYKQSQSQRERSTTSWTHINTLNITMKSNCTILWQFLLDNSCDAHPCETASQSRTVGDIHLRV